MSKLGFGVSENGEPMVDFDRLVRAIYLAGAGLSADEIAIKLGLKYSKHITLVLNALGVHLVRKPGGARRVVLMVSGPRWADVQAEARRRGRDPEEMINAAITTLAKDRAWDRALGRRP